MTRHLQMPSPAMSVALVALFVAMGGSTYAALNLPANSVGTKQLKRDAVTLDKIGPRAKAALSRPTGHAGGDLAGNYPNPTIKSGAITADKLAPPVPETRVAYNLTQTPGSWRGWHDWYSTAASPYGPAAYYRDSQGVVHLSGVSQSGSYLEFGSRPAEQNWCGATPDARMFTLQAGYRPAAREVFAVDSNYAHGRVDVLQNGDVLCVSGAGDVYVSLDGISFRAAG